MVHLARLGVHTEWRLQQVIHLLGHLDIQAREGVGQHNAHRRQSDVLLQNLVLQAVLFSLSARLCTYPHARCWIGNVLKPFWHGL